MSFHFSHTLSYAKALLSSNMSTHTQQPSLQACEMPFTPYAPSSNLTCNRRHSNHVFPMCRGNPLITCLSHQKWDVSNSQLRLYVVWCQSQFNTTTDVVVDVSLGLVTRS
jgi:hypothetical protein